LQHLYRLYGPTHSKTFSASALFEAGSSDARSA
jgi:hypothetical protein